MSSNSQQNTWNKNEQEAAKESRKWTTSLVRMKEMYGRNILRRGGGQEIGLSGFLLSVARGVCDVHV